MCGEQSRVFSTAMNSLVEQKATRIQLTPEDVRFGMNSLSGAWEVLSANGFHLAQSICFRTSAELNSLKAPLDESRESKERGFVVKPQKQISFLIFLPSSVSSVKIKSSQAEKMEALKFLSERKWVKETFWCCSTLVVGALTIFFEFRYESNETFSVVIGPTFPPAPPWANTAVVSKPCANKQTGDL